MIISLISHLKTETNISYYPLIMPTDCNKPAGVYTIINNKDNQGVGGCVSSSELLIQIDLYAKTYKAVNELSTEVKEVLYSFELYPMRLNIVDTFETETELFRKIITFSMREHKD